MIYAKRAHTHEHDNEKHVHTHTHAEAMHAHAHGDETIHVHAHNKLIKKRVKNVTPWALFIIFLFGPCEPLIPLLMYPAATMNTSAVLMVTIAFGLTTIMTMVFAVSALYFGSKKIQHNALEKYSHALAGFAVLSCGIAVTFIGL